MPEKFQFFLDSLIRSLLSSIFVPVEPIMEKTNQCFLQSSFHVSLLFVTVESSIVYIQLEVSKSFSKKQFSVFATNNEKIAWKS